MRLLILEDYFPLQQELVELVEKAGHQAVGVSNATEATDYLENNPVDAVIADIFVKEGDNLVPDGGILLISRIRTNIKGKLQIAKDAPILAVTGATEHYNQTAPVNIETRFGADVCLRKPFDVADIVEWIKSLPTSG